MGIRIPNFAGRHSPSCEDSFWPAAIVQADRIAVRETKLPLGSRRPQHFVSSVLSSLVSCRSPRLTARCPAQPVQPPHDQSVHPPHSHVLDPGDQELREDVPQTPEGPEDTLREVEPSRPWIATGDAFVSTAWSFWRERLTELWLIFNMPATAVRIDSTTEWTRLRFFLIVRHSEPSLERLLAVREQVGPGLLAGAPWKLDGKEEGGER